LCKIGKNTKRPKTAKKAHSSPHATSETKNSRNAEIGTNIAHGVRVMPELLVFELCTALIHENAEKCAAVS